MPTNLLRAISMLMFGMLTLSACNLPAGAPAPSATPAPPQATDTSQPVLPTETAIPTETFTPAATATETATPEPSITPTPEVTSGEVSRETNCRVGPAGNYTLVATYQAGQKLEILARDLGNGYVFVRNPGVPSEECYLLANNLKITGDLAALPQITPPPSPLPAPGFTATFRKVYRCKEDMHLEFVIENTGGSAFRSAYIKATDQKTGTSTEQVVSAFDLWAECVVARNIAPLDPGSTGYLYTIPFKTNVLGRKINVIIQICTEKGLKGQCATQIFEVRPE